MDAETVARPRRTEWLVLVAATVVLLALRLPFLPPTLEDIDSVNFDLGVHDFDPGDFRPHPPGYPVYIFLARLIHPVADSHAAGLALVSVLFSALSVVPLYWLMRRLAGQSAAALVCVLTLFNPIVWFNSVRPMSDLTGFFLVMVAQCLLVTALLGDGPMWSRRRTWWLVGTVLAGISIGARSQALWLVGPVLLYGTWRLRSLRAAVVTCLCFAAAIALWLLPLLVLSGGLERYVNGLVALIRNSLPVEPLVNGFTTERATVAAADVLLTPWRGDFGEVVLVLAGVGIVILARSDRRLLGVLALLFLPYTLYHYLLQATVSIRYAIPIIPLVACLASVPILRAARRVPLLVPVAAVAAAATAAVLTVPALAAYHSIPSPPFQALAALDRLDAAPEEIAVTGHHMFERYLPLISKHEVLLPTDGARQTLSTYWAQGGRKPLVFFQEAMRTTLLFFGLDQPERLGRWRWPEPVRPFMRGERPGWVDLVRLDAPHWFAESGFLVSAEAGPLEEVLQETHRLRLRTPQGALVVSGFLTEASSADISLNLPGRPALTWSVGERFTLRTLLDARPGPSGYLPVSLQTTAPAVFTDVWFESDDRAFIRPSDGFYIAERDEASELYRWIAPEAVATVYLPASQGRVLIEGWIPDNFYRLPLVVSLEWNGTLVSSVDVTTPRFRIEQDLPGSIEEPWGELRIRSSQSFVPDELQGNGDPRTLAARIYTLTLD